jgi:hypothetical protein
MLHPNFIQFEKPKNELYLTLSAVVSKGDQKTIKNIQNKIEGFVKKSDKLKYLAIESKVKDLHDKITEGEDRFIYRYPLHTLHSSIINLATYTNISFKDFEKSRKIIQNTDNFKKLYQRNKHINNFLKKYKSIEVTIKRIYLPAGIENSLALNIFPKEKTLFDELEKTRKEIEKKLNKEKNPISHNVEIKAFPKKNHQYLALNIFRFIDREKFLINEGGTFYSKIEEINSKLTEIEIKMNPCLVVSDPYLSNDDPKIEL